ncbi:MAG: tetratricopeptide (TPR) repeat protein [Planctomycetota bacterium]|jgi:tetratricopeptide (TPR) repeat protein
MTGVLPPEHGVHENGRAPLGNSLATLAEISREHGLGTGGFVSALVLDRRFGLERGFDVYKDDLDNGYSIRGAITVDRALKWLEGRGQDPFFAWVHLFDAHAPYSPPNDLRGDNTHPYHGEIAYMDQQVGRLLDWLETAGRMDDTLVVVTSDHGESLGEHGELTHSTLIYEATQRVPLLVSAPGFGRSGLVVSTPVHLVDVFTSICQVLDWTPPQEVRGQSFAPALRGEAIETAGHYMESEYARINFGWARLRALVDGAWKYHHGPRPELYNVRKDPGELHNRIGSLPERAAAMKLRLDALLDRLETHQTGALALDGDMAEGMQALGYAQGDAGAVDEREEQGDARNPVELIEVAQTYARATGLCQRERFAEAIPLLEQVIEADPRAAEFRVLLGVCYSKTDRDGEAIRVLQVALAIDESHERAHLEIASALLHEDRVDEAFQHVRRAIAIRPSYREARFKLGEMLRDRGELSASLEQYRAVLDMLPLEDKARDAAVEILRELGRTGELIRTLMAGVRDDPSSEPDWAARAAFELATASAEELRDPQLALSYARAANKASGRSSERHLDALAAAQASSGNFEGALKSAGEALRIARDRGHTRFAQNVERRLALYRAGKPYRQ